MVKYEKLERLFAEGLIRRLRPTEKERYVNFFTTSSKENLEHAESVKKRFPRWSIISAYYAMHDAAKLLLAEEYNLHISYKVHTTTIATLKALSEKEFATNLEEARKEFILFANDLAEAKRERVKAQYYTGTPFMKEQFRKKAEELIQKAKRFLERVSA